MRGDGDEPLSEESSIELLKEVIGTQRRLLKEVTGKNPEDLPQLWAVYKEVQQYYEKGIEIPSDVTVMLCDDNWGNLRMVPRENDRQRQGGYGLYYHFDYVGGPRNYKWINTSPLPRVWEQLNLAFNNEIKNIWIVNAGDIKPLEFPLDFFLTFAWDPDTWSYNELTDFTFLWAKQQFGREYANEIADIITLYTKYNARRKPELLGPFTYNLTNFREAERVLSEYNALVVKTLKTKKQLSKKYLDAYYELIEYPVLAAANLNELHILTGKNHLYARQGRAFTNNLAERVEKLFQKDRELADLYHQAAGSKWNHMASQSHISYTGWQQPDKDVLPDLKRIELSDHPEMGVSIEGSENWWPFCQKEASLPEFSPFGTKTFYFEIFNRGKLPLTYRISCEADWIIISETGHTIDKEKRFEVSINWQKNPAGRNERTITVQGPRESAVKIRVVTNNYNLNNLSTGRAFIEANNIVCMEAGHFSKKIESSSMQWCEIPNLGKTISGMTCLPISAKEFELTTDSPRLEYNVFLLHIGKFDLFVYHSPDNDLGRIPGLCYAIGLDDEKPITVNVHAGQTKEDWHNPLTTNEDWNKAVADNIRISRIQISIKKTGLHIIKYHALSSALVLQKIVVSFGPLPDSYLGPEESFIGRYPLDIPN
jgi:hypothetical protein